jgi:hypothetical protein
MPSIPTNQLVEGTLYIKIHIQNGHQFPARKFLGMSEFGYAKFELTTDSYTSESPELWKFYSADSTDLPIPVAVPSGWVEGANGYFDSTVQPKPKTYEEESVH